MDQRLTLESLEHRTIQAIMMEENHEQLQSAITYDLADIRRCYHSLLRREPIALFIGEQQMVFRNGAGTLTHERWAESPLGFHYSCDLQTMLTFLPNTWLASDGVNGAISALVTPRNGVQYMSSDWAANIHSNLEGNVPVNPEWILRLSPDTNMIVFPMNINQSHWVTVLITCFGGTLRASLYNSLSSLGNMSAIVRNLPRIIKAIITANPEATRWVEARWGQKQVSGVRTLQQENLDDCGVFAIRNCVSLLQRQAPFLTSSESTAALREQYLRAYVDGANRAPEHVFVDITVGQTSQNEPVVGTPSTN